MEVLRQSKIEFDVKLFPKDLKNLAKKEELIKSRVHLECSGDCLTAFTVEVNLDEHFDRHSKDRDESANKYSLGEQQIDEENEEMEAVEPDQENVEMREQQEPEMAQKQQNKKRKKKSKLLSGTSKKSSSTLNRKPYQIYLPNSLYECTWLENTPKNIAILDHKNK